MCESVRRTDLAALAAHGADVRLAGALVAEGGEGELAGLDDLLELGEGTDLDLGRLELGLGLEWI